MHRTIPSTKNYPAQNVNGAKAEKNAGIELTNKFFLNKQVCDEVVENNKAGCPY